MVRKPGKLIDTWEWQKPGIATVEVQVRMVKGSQPSFVADCDKLDLHETGTDLSAVKKRVFAILEEKHSITWERFLAVEYESRHSVCSHDDGEVESWEEHFQAHRLGAEESDGLWGPREFDEYMNFNLEVKEVEIGTYSDGSKCWRYCRSSHSQPGEPTASMSCRWSRGNEQLSLIPATLENRRALHRLFQAYGALDKKMREVLSQDKLQDTLARLLAGVVPLSLPSPEEAKTCA